MIIRVEGTYASTLSGPALRRTNVIEESGLQFDCDIDVGAEHQSKYNEGKRACFGANYSISGVQSSDCRYCPGTAPRRLGRRSPAREQLDIHTSPFQGARKWINRDGGHPAV